MTGPPIAARPITGRTARQADAQHRSPLLTYVLRGEVLTGVTMPVIYSLIVPFLLLDAWVTLYQAVCFRAWGIAHVRRGDYFAIDRHKLGYLNGLEKANCVYCSYVTGMIEYVREIAARTEQYWCPIRHARATRHAHPRQSGFVSYGDGAGYRAMLPSLRQRLKK